jgi:hypothetical protein
MLLRRVPTALFIVLAISTGNAQQVVRITKPADNSQVAERPYIEGTVSDPNAIVWVIVHPMEVSECWVQQSVTVKENKTWKVQVHIGRAGDVDMGKHFEIRAIANPKEKLLEGAAPCWPEAESRSQVIEVTRK